MLQNRQHIAATKGRGGLDCFILCNCDEWNEGRNTQLAPNKDEFCFTSNLLMSVWRVRGALTGAAWPSCDECCSGVHRSEGVEIDRENDSDLLVLTTASYSLGCHASAGDGPRCDTVGDERLKMGRGDLSLGYRRRLALKKKPKNKRKS